MAQLDNNTRAAFAQLSSTQGWYCLKALAQVIIQELERLSIDEDDPTKANAFKYDARGARKFWETLTQRVEFIQSMTDKPEDPREEFYAIIPEGNNGTTASS